MGLQPPSEECPLSALLDLILFFAPLGLMVEHSGAVSCASMRSVGYSCCLLPWMSSTSCSTRKKTRQWKQLMHHTLPRYSHGYCVHMVETPSQLLAATRSMQILPRDSKHMAVETYEVDPIRKDSYAHRRYKWINEAEQRLPEPESEPESKPEPEPEPEPDQDTEAARPEEEEEYPAQAAAAAPSLDTKTAPVLSSRRVELFQLERELQESVQFLQSVIKRRADLTVQLERELQESQQSLQSVIQRRSDMTVATLLKPEPEPELKLKPKPNDLWRQFMLLARGYLPLRAWYWERRKKALFQHHVQLYEKQQARQVLKQQRAREAEAVLLEQHRAEQRRASQQQLSLKRAREAQTSAKQEECKKMRRLDREQHVARAAAASEEQRFATPSRQQVMETMGTFLPKLPPPGSQPSSSSSEQAKRATSYSPPTSLDTVSATSIDAFDDFYDLSGTVVTVLPPPPPSPADPLVTQQEDMINLAPPLPDFNFNCMDGPSSPLINFDLNCMTSPTYLPIFEWNGTEWSGVDGHEGGEGCTPPPHPSTL